jgi:hypothetical protein
MPDKKGGGCFDGCMIILLVSVLTVGIFFIFAALSDYRIRKQVDEKFAARALLDVRYGNELKRLDKAFETVFQRCSKAEKEEVSGAREYFHIGEEASHRGADDYRREKFEELERGITQMTALVEVLQKNPQLGPMEAKNQLKDFSCF